MDKLIDKLQKTNVEVGVVMHKTVEESKLSAVLFFDSNDDQKWFSFPEFENENDVDDLFYKLLIDGFEIDYISDTMHVNCWRFLNGQYLQVLPDHSKKGAETYIKWCINHDIIDTYIQSGEAFFTDKYNYLNCVSAEYDWSYYCEKFLHAFLESEPLYISDSCHLRALRELESELECSKNIHGIKAYFDYCEQQGIPKSNLNGILCSKLISHFNELYGETLRDVKISNEYKSLHPCVQDCIKYIMSEPFYNDIKPMYALLYDNYMTECYFEYNGNSVVRVENVQGCYQAMDLDYEFNYLEYFINELSENVKILFMSKESHEDAIDTLFFSDKYNNDILYLKYAQRNKVVNVLPSYYKEKLEDLYKKYGINNKKSKEISR